MNWAMLIAEILLGIAVLFGVLRLIAGPGAADRVVALDLLTMVLIGWLALEATTSNQPVLLDVALSIGLLGFMATVAIAVFIEHQNAADRGADGATMLDDEGDSQ